jgi:hypothetical protein
MNGFNSTLMNRPTSPTCALSVCKELPARAKFLSRMAPPIGHSLLRNSPGSY